MQNTLIISVARPEGFNSIVQGSFLLVIRKVLNKLHCITMNQIKSLLSLLIIARPNVQYFMCVIKNRQMLQQLRNIIKASVHSID